jgi:hypothetical protein
MKTRLLMLFIQIAILGLSCVLACLSVFIPVSIHNREELSQVNLGFPVRFLVQNQIGVPIGWNDGPSFPSQRTFISPWENPFHVSWVHFLLDIAIIFCALNLIYIFILIIRKRFSNPPYLQGFESKNYEKPGR